MTKIKILAGRLIEFDKNKLIIEIRLRKKAPSALEPQVGKPSADIQWKPGNVIQIDAETAEHIEMIDELMQYLKTSV